MQIANLSGLPGSVRLTASIGVAVSQPRDTVTELLLRSDEALYRSKREGRNLVSVYRASDDEFETAGSFLPGTIPENFSDTKKGCARGRSLSCPERVSV
jgi:hypothetical protein